MTDSVLIRKGLTAGEQVVTAGVSQLRDGENVLTENQNEKCYARFRRF
ncbi:hypothetical protein [Klebsiella pneumoniae]